VKSESIFVPRNFPGLSQKQPLREKEAGWWQGEGVPLVSGLQARGGLMGEQGCPLARVWAWPGGSLSPQREQVVKSPQAPRDCRHSPGDRVEQTLCPPPPQHSWLSQPPAKCRLPLGMS